MFNGSFNYKKYDMWNVENSKLQFYWKASNQHFKITLNLTEIYFIYILDIYKDKTFRIVYESEIFHLLVKIK